jgi:hypothetical protein
MDKKTDVQGIYRADSGALINKDMDALLAYKKRKQKFSDIDDLKKEVSGIKQDLEEIKDLLRKVIN